MVENAHQTQMSSNVTKTAYGSVISIFLIVVINCLIIKKGLIYNVLYVEVCIVHNGFWFL